MGKKNKKNKPTQNNQEKQSEVQQQQQSPRQPQQQQGPRQPPQQQPSGSQEPRPQQQQSQPKQQQQDPRQPRPQQQQQSSQQQQQGPWQPRPQQQQQSSQQRQLQQQQPQQQQGPWQPRPQQQQPRGSWQPQQQVPPRPQQQQQISPQHQQQQHVSPQPQPQRQPQTPPPSGQSQAVPSKKASNIQASSQDSKAMESLIAESKQMQLSCTIPKRNERPAKKNKGEHIYVETNHLALTIDKSNMIVYHYDVTVEPEKPRAFYREAVELVRREYFPNCYPSFDGRKNIYSYRKLPLQGDAVMSTVTVQDQMNNGRAREITVTIKFANEVNLATIFQYMAGGSSLRIPQEAIQAIDIVLRQPSAKGFLQVGRSYFTQPAEVIELGDGLQIWYGFFQSAIIGTNKTYLNIDVAHRGFPMPIPCVDALAKIMKKSPNNLLPPTRCYSNEILTFTSFIKGLKVFYFPPPIPGQPRQKRTYKVDNVGPPVKEVKFVVDGEGEMNVYDYFYNKHNYKIQYHNLPSLVCGSSKKSITLPIEMCEIVPRQVIMKKLNELQTREMVRLAAVSAPARKQKIVSSMRSIKFNSDPCIKEFKLSVAEEFTKVPARILNPPVLDYKGAQARVNSGVWRSGKFLNPKNLEKWAILNTDSYTKDPQLRNFAEALFNASKEVGMAIEYPYSIKTLSNPRNFDKEMGDFADCQILFVIIPERGPISYAKVKQVAELNLGLLTQCIRSRTISKMSNATALNILLKLNAKLNGINHSIRNEHWPDFFRKPVIVIGADVTHPSRDQPNIPSIAAVAASHDPKAFSYNTIWTIQAPREEIIVDLKSIVKQQLMFFYRATHYKPQAIMFYRDGVSEGQFKEVIDREVSAVKKACHELGGDQYNPPLTFVVVQKRHHTRLFPPKKFASGKNENVPAGTVVDTDIVHPTELDFYLVSHASIQGTSRPTKYHLLCDDSEMSEDDLQEITYNLCYLYTRCTRSVSYPAPTYYAHLAAFRARSYIDNNKFATPKQQESCLEQNKAFSKNSPMFFV
ncbi:protein argonaute-2-like [Cimex lectularius]|uniref:Argonaute n=1 Tax=Cimex lectularius TaxID=79782 RepID=A0A8I6SMM4_CIMLE|nr:protein argonaute-2-like [Cimex lectularius]XP_024085961.1 protein argonaute-2-like [Cimex lectularius]